MTTTLAPVTINVNGKDFIVEPPSINLGNNPGQDYYVYFSTRDGKKFGPIRTASVRGGAKTVGRQLAVAAREHFGTEAIVEARVKTIEGLRRRIADIDPAGRWAESERMFYGEQLAAVEAAHAAQA
jgi:hypothetical protein